MQIFQSRDEVPEKYKWDLTAFFKSKEEFTQSYNECSQMAEKLKEYVNCTKDAQKLYEFLKLEIECIALWEDLYVYSYLKNDESLGISENIICKNKVEQLNSTITNNISFFEPELLQLNQNEYQKLFAENSHLLEFKADLDYIYRKKEHVLTKNEEVIINELTTAMNNYEDLVSTLLNKEHNYGKVKLENGQNIEIAVTNFRLLTKNKNLQIRQKVYNSFNKILAQYADTNAYCLNSYVAMNDKIAQIRKYKDSWNQYLFSQNITDKVFKTLVQTTENNLNVLHRYYALKKEVLGFAKFHLYDMNLDLVKSSREYTIEEAQELVQKAIEPLGKDYQEKYNKIIENHYIDYCQYKGKCSGGYSMSSIKQDSRILMSYNGNLDSVSTIAHECGHNVHHQFIKENNPYQYRFPSTLICEVISLTNECLLSNYLMQNGQTKEEKLAGIANILDVIVSNLYGAVREGKIEQEMYQEVKNGGTITKDFMDQLTVKSIKKYYGPAVNIDKYGKNKWITRMHYFMHFYLYSYAICISVASSIASKIINGDKEVLNKYLEFMKIGSDKWPIEAFKILDINLEESKVYEDAINYFDSLITKFYEIYQGEEM